MKNIIFDDHGLYSPWSDREIWPLLRVAISLKLERPCPPKVMYMHVTSTPTCMNFLSWFNQLKFLMTMDYSMVQREIWLFLKVATSPKLERPQSATPTKIMQCTCMLHQLLYLHKFFEPIDRLNFLMTMDYIVHGSKGKFGRFWRWRYLRNQRGPPTKIGVHAFDINHYLHKFFGPIPID